MDHVRGLVRKQRLDGRGIRHVGPHEARVCQLLGLEQVGHAAVVAAGIGADHLDALADQLADRPGADAAVGSGNEKALAHAPATGLNSGSTPSTLTSTTSPGASASGGSRK